MAFLDIAHQPNHYQAVSLEMLRNIIDIAQLAMLFVFVFLQR